jgi:chromosome segregation ATPase
VSKQRQYIAVELAEQLTGRTDTTLLRWHRAGKVRRRVVAGRVQYHQNDLRQRMAELAQTSAEVPPLPSSSGDLLDRLVEAQAARDLDRQHLEDLRAAYRTIQAERDALRMQVRVAQAGQVHAEAECERVRVALTQVQGALGQAMQDLEHARGERDLARQAQAAAQRERDQMRRERDLARTARVEAEQGRDATLQEAAQLTSQLKRVRGRIAALEKTEATLNRHLIWLHELMRELLGDALVFGRKGSYQQRYDAGPDQMRAP